MVMVRRFLAVGRMVVAIYAGYKGLQIAGWVTGASRRPDYYDAHHRRSARLIYNTAVRHEGLLIKACQFAGARADILPLAYVEILSELQDRVPPRPFSAIAPWIESQLGRSLGECFEHIEEVPVAAASLAQVHRGRMLGGREVAVKVQYPQIDRIIATDMANFSFFINLLAFIERSFDFRILLDEVRKYVPEELDFVNEANNARRLAENFAEDDSVMFPTPIAELSSRTILTMDYIEGIKVSDVEGLDAAGIDKHRVAELLVTTYLRQVLVHGFLHGDPHPGNLLVRPGPVLVILDLGLAMECSEELRRGLIKLSAAIIARDAARIGAAFRELGFETRSGDDDTFITLGELFLGQALEAHQAYADLAMIERIQEQLFGALRANPIVKASSDLLLVLRVMGLLSGLGKQLDSQVDPLTVMMPFLTGREKKKD